MTYVSEYFHCFASMDVKEAAARRVQKFVQFNQSVEALQKGTVSVLPLLLLLLLLLLVALLLFSIVTFMIMLSNTTAFLDYESGAQELLDWIQAATQRMEERNFAESSEDAKAQFDAQKRYV